MIYIIQPTPKNVSTKTAYITKNNLKNKHSFKSIVICYTGAIHYYKNTYAQHYISKLKTCLHPEEAEWDFYINTKQIQ